MLIDIHAHINFSDYSQDGDSIIRHSLSNEVWLVVPGIDYKSSKCALDYANKYEKGVFAAVGLHPNSLKGFCDSESGQVVCGEEFNNDVYEKLASFPKVVGVGEIGLDYYLQKNHRAAQIKEKQKEVFVKQLTLARRFDLPVIIHCRQAHDDMIEILSDFRKSNRNLIPSNRSWGVLHCFSGDEDLAWKYFNLGLMISFTGLITFSRQWDDLIRKMPLDKIMIETDSPFLTPEPFRGQRNEPILVKYVAERIAQIRNLSLEKIAEITTKNAREFFGI